jgi:putative restriction endonuclease
MSPDPFCQINVGRHAGQRLPYQPLLVLFALGRWAAGNRNPLRFSEVEDAIRRLMEDFGPQRSRHLPELPFWHLRSSGTWEVTPDTFTLQPGRSGPTAQQLRDSNATGQFSASVRAMLATNPAAIPTLAGHLLTGHFPTTLHADILAAVGLALEAPTITRSPAFRDAVLVAYSSACAVCGVGVRLLHAPVGVEAAHIQWWSCEGPDVVPNGMCLCSLHHKLFDRGAFTLTPDLKVEVSPLANGPNVGDALGRFDREPIARTVRPEDRPAEEFISWHRKDVFRG